MDELTAAFSVVIADPADYLIVKETRDSIADFLKHRRDDQIRICYMREALVPDFNLFDYASGFDASSTEEVKMICGGSCGPFSDRN